MAIAKMPCGGFAYDDGDFEFVNGAFSTAGTREEGVVDYPIKTMFCGGFKYDAESFEIYEVGNKKIISFAGAEVEDIGDPVVLSCSLMFDSNTFELEDGVLKISG